MNTTKFSLFAVGLAAMLTAILWLLESSIGGPGWLKFIPIAFAVINIGAYAWLESVEKRRPNRYVPTFMGAMSLKMFAVMVGIAVYIFQHPEFKYEVGLTALICHLIFLTLFTVSGYNKARRSATDKA